MLTALALSAALAADTSQAAGQALNAYHLTAAMGAPVLDGKLDDPVWAAPASAAGFTQKHPQEGQPARFPPVVRIAFDETAVYVAARAAAPEPAKIVPQLTRRDQNSPSDWLLIGF